MNEHELTPELLVEQVIADARQKSGDADPLLRFRNLTLALQNLLAQLGTEVTPIEVPTLLLQSNVSAGIFVQALQRLNIDGCMSRNPTDDEVARVGRALLEVQFDEPLRYSSDIGSVVFDDEKAFAVFEQCKEYFGLTIPFAEFCRRLGIEMTPDGHPIFGIKARVLRCIRTVLQTAE